VKKATAATKKLAAKKAASIKKTASTKKEKAAITDSSKKQPAAAVVPPSGSKADPSLAPAVGIIAVGAPAAPSSGGLLNSAAATSSSAGPTAAATHAPAVSVSAASLGTALLRQHESSITLMRYAEQLELDRAQLAGEKTKLGSSIERLTQEQADLQRQLKELAEQADKVPLLEAALRLRNREVEEARRRLMAADDAAKEHAEQSRRSLENVQQLLDEKEDELKQQTAAASHKAAEAKRQLEAQTKVNQQLESDLIQASQDIARVRQANGRLTQEKMQLDQDKTLLQRQIDDRLAELATAESHIAAAVGWAERIVSLKQAAGGADAQSPGQLILAGKRKAESELESEAKRRRSAEDKLDALAEQMDKTDKCVVCADKQPDVLFQSCNHLACCNECADQLEQGAAGDPACPLCREPLDSSDIIKVFRA
jgi:DNA repair exonuclease SbcCD ATPase subunit